MDDNSHVKNDENDDIEKIDIKFSPDIRNWFDNGPKSEEIDVQTLNWFDRFSNDDQVELTTTVCECVDEYVKENIMNMYSANFVSEMYSEITELMMATWIDGDICTDDDYDCLLYTSPSPRDRQKSRMPSSA